MNQIWHDIPDYKGSYQISIYGEIKSMNRFRNYKGTLVSLKERILKYYLSGKGYKTIKLYKDGKAKVFRVHQLMAIVFLNFKPDGTMKITVDHKDNNKLNNHKDNLQLISNRKNASKDRFRKKYSSKYVGVYWSKQKNKWHASIYVNKTKINLGFFKNEYDAHLAYQSKLKEIEHNIQ